MKDIPQKYDESTADAIDKLIRAACLALAEKYVLSEETAQLILEKILIAINEMKENR